jgi:hypothetical protein
MELFEFKDTFCCSLFRETKYNTSLKPNLLAGLFQHSFKIECKFIVKDNGKAQWIFSKQGIVNSGVYINANGDKLYCILSTTSNDIDFSNNETFMVYDFEYGKEYTITYEVNVENNTFITAVNGDIKTNRLINKVSDYSNVPLWIGTSNPFLETKNYFNGIISEFIVSNNEGIVSDLDFSNVNRFKVWDKSGNGNFAYIEEFMNKIIQIKLNKLLAGNSLETKDITNIKQTLI